MIQLIKLATIPIFNWVGENLKFTLGIISLVILAIFLKVNHKHAYDKGRTDEKNNTVTEQLRDMEEHRKNEADITELFNGVDVDGLCNGNERDCSY